MSGRHRQPPRRRTSNGRHRKPTPPMRYAAPAFVIAAVLAGSGVGIALTDSSPSRSATVVGSSPRLDPLRLDIAAIEASASPTATATPVTSSPLPPVVITHSKKRDAVQRQVVPPTLALRIVGSSSYLEVRTGSGKLLRQTILHHGDRATFRQHGLQVVLGNAGAVKLSLHGHPARVAGRSGQVRSFVVK